MWFSCSVCWDQFIPSDDIYAAPCGHILHLDCWHDWLSRKRNCPDCRQRTRLSHLIKLFININEGSEYTKLSNKYATLKSDLTLKTKDCKDAERRLERQRKKVATLRKEIETLERRNVVALEKQSSSHAKLKKWKLRKTEILRSHRKSLKLAKTLRHHVKDITGKVRQVSEDMVKLTRKMRNNEGEMMQGEDESPSENASNNDDSDNESARSAMDVDDGNTSDSGSNSDCGSDDSDSGSEDNDSSSDDNDSSSDDNDSSSDDNDSSSDDSDRNSDDPSSSGGRSTKDD